MKIASSLTNPSEPVLAKILWHGVALFVVIVWGSTFASTRILLNSLTPEQILLYRSLIALVLLLLLARPRLVWRSVKTELLYLIAGICGITLYFIFENVALLYTYSSNAALLVTASPLFTVLIASFVFKTQAFNQRILVACLLALLGVGMVLANQSLSLSQGLFGNLLALLAGLVWAFYNFAMEKVDDALSPILRTQKVFFYGIITTAVYMLVTGKHFVNQAALEPLNLANLGFLGVIASALCYVLWNRANHHLGVVQTSLYLYFMPLVAVVLGVWLLAEHITWMTVMGGLLITLAVVLANAKKNG